MTIEYKNATFQEIAQVVKQNDNFVICGHVNPDGDCISSQVALTVALKSIGKNVFNLIADKETVDVTLDFLPWVDDFVYAKNFDVNEYIDDEDFVFVSVDVPMLRRIGKYAPDIKEKAKLSITIDHHEPEDLDFNYVFCDPSSASASLLMWEFCPYLGIDVTENSEIATACLCGVISDTGSFRYQNADERCFAAAGEMVKAGANPAEISRNLFQRRSVKSLQMESRVIEHMFVNSDLHFAVSYLCAKDFEEFNATKEDADFMIDMIRSLDCVEVACILRQEVDGQKVHGSLRSKTDLDVSIIAKQYVGGGHKAAAGFTMAECTDITLAFEEIKIKIAELCSHEKRNN